MAGSAPRVFVSHSHKDDEFTTRLVNDLIAAGADVWVDVVGIDSGDFIERINAALATREWLVLVLTPDAVQSGWVRKEVNAAINLVEHGHMRQVIPILAKSVNQRDVPPLWSTLHRYDATRDYQGAVGGLLRAMGVGVSVEQPPTTPSPLSPRAARPAKPSGASPASNFDHFTARARGALVFAEAEARRLNHNYIGTEHLLLGLVQDGGSVAGQALHNLGVELNKARSAVEYVIGRGDRLVTGEIGLSPRAKTVIELSVDEARRLNAPYLGTEHLLLGIIREGAGVAVGILESLGVSPESARAETLDIIATRENSGS